MSDQGKSAEQVLREIRLLIEEGKSKIDEAAAGVADNRDKIAKVRQAVRRGMFWLFGSMAFLYLWLFLIYTWIPR